MQFVCSSRGKIDRADIDKYDKGTVFFITDHKGWFCLVEKIHDSGQDSLWQGMYCEFRLTSDGDYYEHHDRRGMFHVYV